MSEQITSANIINNNKINKSRKMITQFKVVCYDNDDMEEKNVLLLTRLVDKFIDKLWAIIMDNKFNSENQITGNYWSKIYSDIYDYVDQNTYKKFYNQIITCLQTKIHQHYLNKFNIDNKSNLDILLKLYFDDFRNLQKFGIKCHHIYKSFVNFIEKQHNDQPFSILQLINEIWYFQLFKFLNINLELYFLQKLDLIRQKIINDYVEELSSSTETKFYLFKNTMSKNFFKNKCIENYELFFNNLQMYLQHLKVLNLNYNFKFHFFENNEDLAEQENLQELQQQQHLQIYTIFINKYLSNTKTFYQIEQEKLINKVPDLIQYIINALNYEFYFISTILKIHINLKNFYYKFVKLLYNVDKCNDKTFKFIKYYNNNSSLDSINVGFKKYYFYNYKNNHWFKQIQLENFKYIETTFDYIIATNIELINKEFEYYLYKQEYQKCTLLYISIYKQNNLKILKKKYSVNNAFTEQSLENENDINNNTCENKYTQLILDIFQKYTNFVFDDGNSQQNLKQCYKVVEDNDDNNNNKKHDIVDQRQKKTNDNILQILDYVNKYLHLNLIAKKYVQNNSLLQIVYAKFMQKIEIYNKDNKDNLQDVILKIINYYFTTKISFLNNNNESIVIKILITLVEKFKQTTIFELKIHHMLTKLMLNATFFKNSTQFLSCIENFIKYYKEMLGTQSVLKYSTMIEDFKISKKLNHDFATYCKNHDNEEYSKTFKVKILKSNCWPKITNISANSFNLLGCFKIYTNVFETWYLTSFKDRKLMWNFTLASHVNLQSNFGNLSIKCSLLQASILMLFVNTNTILSFNDLVDKLSITDLNYLKLELGKMLYNKTPLLLITNTNNFCNNNADNLALQTFSLTNIQQIDKNNKSIINILSPVKVIKKNKLTPILSSSSIEQKQEYSADQKLQIESSIVRIVKIEKSIEQQILFEKYIVCKYKTLTVEQFTLIIQELLQREYIYITDNTKLCYNN